MLETFKRKIKPLSTDPYSKEVKDLTAVMSYLIRQYGPDAVVCAVTEAFEQAKFDNNACLMKHLYEARGLCVDWNDED